MSQNQPIWDYNKTSILKEYNYIIEKNYSNNKTTNNNNNNNNNKNINKKSGGGCGGGGGDNSGGVKNYKYRFIRNYLNNVYKFKYVYSRETSTALVYNIDSKNKTEYLSQPNPTKVYSDTFKSHVLLFSPSSNVHVNDTFIFKNIVKRYNISIEKFVIQE